MPDLAAHSAVLLPQTELLDCNRVPIKWLNAEQKVGNHKKFYDAIRYRLQHWAKANLNLFHTVGPDSWAEGFYEKLAGRWCRNDIELSRLIMMALRRTEAPQCIVDFMKQLYQGGESDNKGKRWISSQSMLLTWNGDWGLLPEGIVTDATDWRHLVAQLSQLASVQSLWKGFHDFINILVFQFNLDDWACSLELCTSTWHEQRRVRIHAHLCFKSSSKVRCRNPLPFSFRGCSPHKSHSILTLQNRIMGSWCGMYYLLCPKIGKLFSASSKESFLQFPVSSEWIFSLLQCEKIELVDAREEIVRCGKGLVRKLADFDRLAAARRERDLHRRVAEIQKAVAQTNRSFKTFEVVEEWKRQATQPCQRRKKFLVLEGASGVGKTEYARSLFGAEQTLELNCANCHSSPDLRTFDATKHRCVLFDEAHVQLILDCRKVFQAPACWLDLGHSPTGVNVYRVFLNDAVLVIGSNIWSEELQNLRSASDREWILSNQVHLLVKEPMWIPAEE